MELAVVHPAELGLHDEAVHPAVVDIGHRISVAVRSAGVAIGRVMKRALGAGRARTGDAGDRPGVTREARDAVGARAGTEGGVERAVLLHDDHDVADLVDPLVAAEPDPAGVRSTSLPYASRTGFACVWG